MITETRESTLQEIDRKLRQIHADLAGGMDPLQQMKIARLRSEREWILDHTPGLRGRRAS